MNRVLDCRLGERNDGSKRALRSPRFFLEIDRGGSVPDIELSLLAGGFFGIGRDSLEGAIDFFPKNPFLQFLERDFNYQRFGLAESSREICEDAICDVRNTHACCYVRHSITLLHPAFEARSRPPKI